MPTNLGEFIWWGFLLVLSVCGFLAINTLSKIDRNQTELFNRINNHETRLSALEGAHNAIHGGTK